MILRSIEHVGSYAFAHKPIYVDFENLPLVVCVAGLTGSGKSSLLDLCMAGLYLIMPYRPGPLYRRFAKKGYIRLRWGTAEKYYYSDIRVDPFAEKVEASLYEDPDSRPAGERRPHIAGPLSRDFLKATEQIAGPLDGALVGMYSVQTNPNREHKTGSFLSLSKSDRRELFADLLALGRYEKWYDLASSYVTSTTAQLERVRGRVDELEKLSRQVAGAKIALEEGQREIDRLTVGVELAKQYEALTGYETQVADIKKRLKANSDLLAKKDAISEAVRVHARAVSKIAALDPSVAEHATVAAQVKGAEDRMRAIRDQADEHAAIFKQADQIRAQAAQVTEIDRELEALEEDISNASIVFKALLEGYNGYVANRSALKERLAGDRAQITVLEGLAGRLSDVPCRGVGEYAGCPLLEGSKAAADKLYDLSNRVAEASLDLHEAEPVPPVDPTAQLVAQRNALRQKKYGLALAKKLPTLQAASAAKEMLVAESAALEAQLVKWRPRLTELDDHLSLRQENIRLRDAQQELLALKPHLDLAEERIRERTMQLEQIEHTVSLTKQALAEYEKTVPIAPKSVRAATVALQEAHKAYGALEERWKAAQSAEAEYEALKPQVDQIIDTLSLWTQLAKAFSPLGIPTLRVDQALPAIGLLATEMLKNAYGEQIFTIKVKSQRESADGKKLIEDLRVDVLRNNEEVDVSILSGGESVLVSESISLAWSLFGAQNAGRRYHTLIRDESSSALDATKAPAYIRLLRRAAELGDFSRVFFVSHQPACEQVADAVLRVADGTISVEAL